MTKTATRLIGSHPPYEAGWEAADVDVDASVEQWQALELLSHLDGPENASEPGDVRSGDTDHFATAGGASRADCDLRVGLTDQI